MSYQAILTRYLGPTNIRPARVKATCAIKSVTLPWDAGMSVDANHARAARTLIESMDWEGDWFRGDAPDMTGYIFVANTMPSFATVSREMDGYRVSRGEPSRLPQVTA